MTMLAWSFVRDDQPLADTARQVALAPGGCRCGARTGPTTCPGRSSRSSSPRPASVMTRRSTPTCVTAEFAAAGYPNEAGPGVWDIHSLRVPSVGEIRDRLVRMADAFPPVRRDHGQPAQPGDRYRGGTRRPAGPARNRRPGRRGGDDTPTQHL